MTELAELVPREELAPERAADPGEHRTEQGDRERARTRSVPRARTARRGVVARGEREHRDGEHDEGVAPLTAPSQGGGDRAEASTAPITRKREAGAAPCAPGSSSRETERTRARSPASARCRGRPSCRRSTSRARRSPSDAPAHRHSRPMGKHTRHGSQRTTRRGSSQRELLDHRSIASRRAPVRSTTRSRGRPAARRPRTPDHRERGLEARRLRGPRTRPSVTCAWKGRASRRIPCGSRTCARTSRRRRGPIASRGPATPTRCRSPRGETAEAGETERQRRPGHPAQGTADRERDVQRPRRRRPA